MLHPFANSRRHQILNLIRKTYLALLIASGVEASSPYAVLAADRSPEVEATIQKGAAYLAMSGSPIESEPGLIAYALMASGRGPMDPAVAPLIVKILAKVPSSEYKAKKDHYYEAGVDAMALAAADKEKYRPQLQAIADYLIANQRDDGAWDYPNQNNGGDTSISQYGMLGLWAAARAGVPIPLKVWDKAAGWHFRAQNPEGSFGYHPYAGTKGGMHSMTVAGVGSLCIARIYLTDSSQSAAEPEDELTGKPKKVEKAFGVLEKAAPMEIADPAEPKSAKPQDDKAYKPLASKRDLDSSIGRGLGWLGGKATYTIEKPIGWSKYYLYGLERATALTRSEKIGGHDWYKEGSQHLIGTQASDGSWLNDPGGAHATTAFGVLFLCRATDKIAPNSPPPKRGATTFGGGLLQGGRGLPTELSAVETKDGQIKAKKLDTPLDKLLSDLESPQTKNVEATQDSIVEAVQVGDRQTLIGKKDLLLRLTRDKRVDVRRTAYWGLGRCNDLRMSSILIQGLLDPDFDVAVEARNALCVLSRRPRGFGLPDDLIATLPENASQVEKDTAFEKWRRDDHQKWKQWYQSVRPYEERDQLAD